MTCLIVMRAYRVDVCPRMSAVHCCATLCPHLPYRIHLYRNINTSTTTGPPPPHIPPPADAASCDKMYLASNNHPREDAIFSGKVKVATKACDGSFVAALGDFEARDAAAVGGGAVGISYAAFLSFLRDHGVSGLSEFESNYLCNSFDDGAPTNKNNAISGARFVRHLTGLNYRRMKAVLQVWDLSTEAIANPDGTVAADDLIDTYRAVQAKREGGDGDSDPAPLFSSRGRVAQLQCSFKRGGDDGSGATVRGPALFRKSVTGAGGSAASEEVTRADFVAFCAGLSPQYPSDEAFEVAILKEWAADRPRQPRMDETQREWGEGGDPLAIGSTHYVRDGLSTGLGVSGKSYNYTHMARVQPYVEPLPPLNRDDLMVTTTQCMYQPYSEEQLTRADPLATRRGQKM